MMHTFNITLANKPAVVERLLRVIRHRGFSLQSMSLTTTEQHHALLITVESERPINTLVDQLEKLYDVNNIKLQ